MCTINVHADSMPATSVTLAQNMESASSVRLKIVCKMIPQVSG